VDELHEYCFGVAGSLVRPLVALQKEISPGLCVPPEPVLTSLEKLACSLQMVNIIRDVKEDSEVQGRCYWPRCIVPVSRSVSRVELAHLNEMISIAIDTFAMSIGHMREIAAFQDTLALPFPWKVLKSLSIHSIAHLARMYDNPQVLQGRFVLDKADWARGESADGNYAESVAFYLDLLVARAGAEAGAGAGAARALALLRA
jgi:phytoene/squalene synthetase